MGYTWQTWSQAVRSVQLRRSSWQRSITVSLFVVATDSNCNGTLVSINKNKYIRVIQVNFVIHAERANDVPNCGVDLRAMNFVVVTAVENDAITASVRGRVR
jgi:hypothetical protein